MSLTLGQQGDMFWCRGGCVQDTSLHCSLTWKTKPRQDCNNLHTRTSSLPLPTAPPLLLLSSPPHIYSSSVVRSLSLPTLLSLRLIHETRLLCSYLAVSVAAVWHAQCRPVQHSLSVALTSAPLSSSSATAPRRPYEQAHWGTHTQEGGGMNVCLITRYGPSCKTPTVKKGINRRKPSFPKQGVTTIDPHAPHTLEFTVPRHPNYGPTTLKSYGPPTLGPRCQVQGNDNDTHTGKGHD